MVSIILGTSLLTGRGVPAARESEVNHVHPMQIKELPGVGGSLTSYYSMAYLADVVLMRHDGPRDPKHRRGIQVTTAAWHLLDSSAAPCRQIRNSRQRRELKDSCGVGNHGEVSVRVIW